MAWFSPPLQDEHPSDVRSTDYASVCVFFFGNRLFGTAEARGAVPRNRDGELRRYVTSPVVRSARLSSRPRTCLTQGDGLCRLSYLCYSRAE
jgi:hypothetical protein